MAKRRNLRRKSKIRPRAKKTVRRRRGSKPTVSSLLVRGARTLIGLLPGQAVLQPIADFMFGDTGIKTKATGPSFTAEDVKFYGVQTAMKLRPIDFVFGSSQLTFNGTDVLTNYQVCALEQATIRVVPTGEVQTRSGMWALALVPFSVATVLSRPYSEVLEIPGAVHGSTGKPIAIRFSPSMHEAGAYTFTDVHTPCCTLYLALSDPQSGSQITYGEFSCQIELSGRIRMGERIVAAINVDNKLRVAKNSSFLCEDKYVNVINLEDGGYMEEEVREEGFEMMN